MIFLIIIILIKESKKITIFFIIKYLIRLKLLNLIILTRLKNINILKYYRDSFFDYRFNKLKVY